MCGFLGAFGPSASVLSQHLPKAMAAMLHRGPDSGGTYQTTENDCFLGHRRLSIVELSENGHQPFLHAQQPNHVLVYNGEIYNHQALRRQLLLPAPAYKGQSDTETLFHLMARFPAETVFPKLNGMFAGAWLQENQKRLYLFRDSLGIKPLYILQLPDSTLLFASEIKALLALAPQFQPQVNGLGLTQYLLFENWPQGMSLIQNIELVQPGSLLTVTLEANSQVSVHRHLFSPEASLHPAFPTETDFTATHSLLPTLQKYLEDSVVSHLMSDVPLGCYLSGGLDSSLVTLFAARHSNSLMGFTGYFEDPDAWYDERPLARAVAEKANISLTEVAITPQHFKDHFDDLIYTLEEPRMGMGSFSQYVVAQVAARHRKVILAGHGGDELFAGYPLFKAFWLLQEFPSFHAFQNLFQLKAKEWPWLIDTMLSQWGAGQLRFAPNLYRPLAHQWQQTHGSFNKPDVSNFCQPRSHNALAQLNNYYLQIYLPGLLAVEDKVSMAHSLETRLPFWSQKIYQQISAIPLSAKLKNGQLKGLLKEASKGILPKELFTAPKRGFPTPLRKWFRGALKEEVHERLLSCRSVLDDLIPKAQRASLLKDHETRWLPFALDERRGHRIWMLLCLDSWSRQFNIRF